MKTPSGKRNLLITAVGRTGKQQLWLQGERSYDLVAICYDEVEADSLAGAADFVYRKGPKFELVDEYRAAKGGLSQYDAIFVPDDDLEMTSGQICELFRIFHEHELSLAQPALTRDSYYSHRITRHCGKSDVVLRRTNFVEIMCPLFSREAFAKCARTFSGSGTGYGLDYAWPNLLDFEGIAIIDRVAVKHLRPVQSYQKLKNAGINPKKLIRHVAELYGSRVYRPKTIGYVRGAS